LKNEPAVVSCEGCARVLQPSSHTRGFAAEEFPLANLGWVRRPTPLEERVAECSLINKQSLIIALLSLSYIKQNPVLSKEGEGM
jgi:hypothetical protein